MYISICGNIGSGKSTLISAIKKEFPEINVQYEPLNEINGLLDYFYTDMKRWSFTLQMKLLGLYSNMIKEHKSDIIITERSQYESFNIFGTILKNKEFLNDEEFKIMEMFYKLNGIKPNVFIYIKTNPYICFERIKQRNRESEKTIDINYLSSLHEEYEKHFIGTNHIFVLNGNISHEFIKRKVIDIIKNINEMKSIYS
tara:strand:+ start:1342 stop:1938 length:597 start_codon:yes stop_codon:yes gene_type:complete